jgi:hypothetical protein
MIPELPYETPTMSAIRSAFGGKSENNSLRDLPVLNPYPTSLT